MLQYGDGRRAFEEMQSQAVSHAVGALIISNGLYRRFILHLDLLSCAPHNYCYPLSLGGVVGVSYPFSEPTL